MAVCSWDDRNLDGRDASSMRILDATWIANFFEKPFWGSPCMLMKARKTLPSRWSRTLTWHGDLRPEGLIGRQNGSRPGRGFLGMGCPWVTPGWLWSWWFGVALEAWGTSRDCSNAALWGTFRGTPQSCCQWPCLTTPRRSSMPSGPW